MTKPLKLILISLFLLNSFLTAFSSPPFKHSTSAATDTTSLQRKIVITGVGDIMLGSAFPDSRLLPPSDNPYLLLGSLSDTLSASDITFGNLEGSFLDSGEPCKKCRDTAICYLFRMPERYITALTSSGFDILSVANNHFGDFGVPGRSRTRHILDSVGINYAGLLEHPWSIFRKDSILYGFCAFAPNSGTVNLNETDEAAAIVRKLSDTCDIVIVSFHGGAEGADFQHVPKATEVFHGENRGDVYHFAHIMIDNGADVVFGHGPHVTRGIEVYRNRFISYSMGNFCTYGHINLAGPNGLAPIVRISVDPQGKFLSGRIIPVYQTWPGGVRYDYNGRVINKIRDLMAVDFPDASIDLSVNGDISYK
jgi:poly-gamma-glutamate capsule biosynthesis protein CapA/YwtB (metallophosphatase superfamily)